MVVNRPDFSGYASVRARVAQTAFQLGDALRGHARHPLSELVPLVLIENAVAATAPSTGMDLSTLVHWDEYPEDPLTGLSTRAAHILAEEADWLLSHRDSWTTYGNEVMRIEAGKPEFGEFSSSRGVEEVLLAICDGLGLADRETLAVLDVTCGRGVLLSALAGHFNGMSISLAGQDVNRTALAMASRNLAVAGRQSALSRADLVVEDGHPELTFDLVIRDGPLGLTMNDREDDADRRYPQELPALKEGDWWTTMMALAKVKPAEEGGGVLVSIMSPGAIGRPTRSANAVRAWIQDRGLTHAVVALPDGVGSLSTSMPLQALVLTTKPSKGFVDRTQIIDLRGSFEAAGVGGRARRITASGLDELRKAMATPKPSAHVRTCTSDEFQFTRWTYEVPETSGIFDGIAAESVTFSHVQRAAELDPAWPGEDRNRNRQVHAQPKDERLTLWDVERVFTPRSAGQAQRALQDLGWSVEPLLLHAKHVEYRRSQGARSGTAETPWNPHTPVLVLPFVSSENPSFGLLEDVEPNGRALLVELDESLDGDFLATWLGTENGKLAREAAHEKVVGRARVGRTLDRSSQVRLLAELLVPTPDSATQERMLSAHELVEAGERRLRRMVARLWAEPRAADEVAAMAKGWSDSGDVGAWADTLPYPLAVSLRTVQAFGHDDEKAARQLVHFWEATATFVATYLLSSLRAADDLWAVEVPRLRTAAQNAGHTFDRASLGTWKLTIERLASLFREKRDQDDADERDRAMRLLGMPPAVVIDSVTSQELVNVLGRLNTARNTLDGHGGTLTAAQASDLRAHFEDLTGELRGALGYGWTQFPLIRPLSLEYDESGFTVSAAVLVGPATPFLTRKHHSPEPLKKDRLYLLGDGGVVDLAPIVQLGRAPRDPETTCWFYNRREPEGVRLVAYQAADNNDVTRHDESLEALLHDLSHLEAPAEVPDVSKLDKA